MARTDHVADLPTLERIIRLLYHGKNVYQPLYNFPHALAEPPLRRCEDRCQVIERELEGEVAGLGILDVGCSLGYNCLYFVDRGAVAHGIDADVRNVEICRAIHPYTGGDATFTHARFDRAFVEAIRPGRYDVAFMFSIMHHLVEEEGLEGLQAMLAVLLAKVPMLFVELATRAEPPPVGYAWKVPEDPLEIFAAAGALDIKLVCHFSTHVASLPRPFYRVVNRRLSPPPR